MGMAESKDVEVNGLNNDKLYDGIARPTVTCHYGQINEPDKNENLKSDKNNFTDSTEEVAMTAILKQNGSVVNDIVKEDTCPEDDDRETWGKKIDFLLSIIGFAVDLANVWRFPYLCYKNGGGAFLIPYFLMLVFGALPLFFMELCLGQFHREGAISVWKIAPLFKGVGWAVCIVSYYVAFYYNVIIAWSFFYLFSSFTSTLPWLQCGQDWNDCFCIDSSFNLTNSSCNYTMLQNSTQFARPATQYFERAMLGVHHSEGIHDLGGPKWQLALCLVLVFTVLYFALWKGVKSSGKVVWVTATMPYVILLILLIRGALLPGAGQGVEYFMVPKLERLRDPQVWNDAGIQVFYSVGAGFGVHLAYASYNKFNNNCYRDCLFTVGINSFTSIFSGFVVFCYLGYMAHEQGIDIENVATEGPGLVFVVYPEAIATLPGSVGWAIIFFFMLLTLGLDSAMGGMESVLTGVKDNYKTFFKRFKWGRELFTLGVILLAFCMALFSVTYGGLYVFTMLDTFAAGTALLFAVFAESVAVAWIYGLDQFCKDIKQMLGFKPNLFWRICWKFISPAFVLVIVVSSVINYKPLRAQTSTNGVFVYPQWANAVGWCIAGSSMVMVPLVAAYQLSRTKGTLKQRLALCLSPEWEHKEIQETWQVSRFKTKHWLTI